MLNVLVTGGAGFIGSNFIEYLLEAKDDVRVINLDKLTYAGNLENLKNVEKNLRYEFVRGDICDSSLVNQIFEKGIDQVVHFAAESHVDRSITDPAAFIQTNVLGTQTLLDAAKAHWEKKSNSFSSKKFLQVSTDEVYGSLAETGFFTESTPLDPHSPYSASKAGADLLAKSYFDTYGFPVVITRCSNNYGPYQFPEKLIPLVINNCINGRPLPVYGDGLNIRDWLYVKDHARALLLALDKGRSGEVYNIGGHNERTNIDLIKTIIKYMKANVDKNITEELITFITDRKGHDRRYAINPEKISRELGWRPETPFEKGIGLTIQWYLDNKEWLERVTTGQYQNYYRQMYERQV
jgi:dTDP-glucose 4,6-dehydratase